MFQTEALVFEFVKKKSFFLLKIPNLSLILFSLDSKLTADIEI